MTVYYRTVSRNRHDMARGTAYCKVLHPSREVARHWATWYGLLGEDTVVEEARLSRSGRAPTAPTPDQDVPGNVPCR